MSTYQKIVILGNLGQDPELRYTKGGTAVANVSLATSEKWKDAEGNPQESTEWHKCVAFGKTAELIEQYCNKGDKLLVEGTLQTRSWEDQSGITKYTTEVKVVHMKFMGSPNRDQQGQGKPAPAPKAPAPDPAHDFSDDIPF